jgi:hypothetical protein
MKGYRLQAVTFHCRLQAQWAKKQSSSGATELKRKIQFYCFPVTQILMGQGVLHEVI